MSGRAPGRGARGTIHAAKAGLIDGTSGARNGFKPNSVALAKT